ncbi:Plasmodium exported protein (PHIST), unknown function [Plasmodium vivax]|uniref:Plasmodium RESA N-terminal domain-containing protein n=1 Tax=Plasmodium vivax TaxID=5855 RepID=A0A1G4H9H8_PLAVI|nr:Plasmodium exported protein (PHIST), unknown function [Plasmodium vivax]
METCHGMICLSVKNSRGGNAKNGKTRFAAFPGRGKKGLRGGFALLGVINAFVLLLLLCVPQTKLISVESSRRARRLGTPPGGFYRMHERMRSNVRYGEMENEPGWEECSYPGSERNFQSHRDQMDYHYDQMWAREEWLRRGRHRYRSSYDICPFGCTDADMLKELSEADINERLAKLGSQVSVREMFILWSNVHRHERKKYIQMQERAKMFCDHLVETFQIPEEVRIRVWMKVHRCMTSVFLRFERRHHKHFFMLLRRGPSARTNFLRYINRTRNVWNMRRVKINSYWRSKMVGFFRGYWNRCFSGAYRGAGVRGYDRVGSMDHSRVGSTEYDSRGVRQHDRRYANRYDSSYADRYDSRYADRHISRYSDRYDSRYAGRYDSRYGGLNDRRGSSIYGSVGSSIYGSVGSNIYGSVGSSLYGSRDSVMCESRDGGVDESRSEGLNDSRSEGLDDSRSESLNGSRNEGLNESRSEGLNESRSEGLNESRSEGLDDSRIEGLDESRSEGLYDGSSESLNESRSEGLYDSINEGLDQSRSEGLDESRVEGLNKRTNGGMEESRGGDNA